MTLSIEQWHQRYLQQARWTQNIRDYLYQKCAIQRAARLLDVGCGTGVLENELQNNTFSHIFGADIDYPTLQFAKNYAPLPHYTVADCLSLPFASASFDITLCHFLLLWIDSIQEALLEMTRVTHPGGYVLAMAEPDYGGRIDYPDELSRIGTWQTLALREQGAQPQIGRQLRSLFSRSRLTDIETGVLGGQWGMNTSDVEFELEWQVLTSDLENNIDFRKQAVELKELESASRGTYQRILFVPVFYAIGVVQEKSLSG